VTGEEDDTVDGQPRSDEVTESSAHGQPGGESLPEPTEPTPEELAERAARADKSISRALAGVLWLEAVCVLLVPRAIAQTSVGLTGVKTGLLIGFAVVLGQRDSSSGGGSGSPSGRSCSCRCSP